MKTPTINIGKIVRQYKTKSKRGFVQSEINELLKLFPSINIDRFNDSLMGISCIVKEGEAIVYRHDIEKALYCGVGVRSLQEDEWD